MKTRGVIGRRIVAVRQQRVQTNTGPAYDVQGIVLDNGAVISFSVAEMPDDYAIEAYIYRPKTPKE